MWFSSVHHRRPTTSGRRKFFPALEPLEERTVPAIFNVTSLADSNVVGSGSLRRAISDANSTPGTNQINILTAGVYQLTLNGANEDNNATGDLDILNSGSVLSLAIVNQSGGSVVIDAGSLTPTDRVFDITPAGPAVDVTITGVTIQGGNTTGGGGGIRVQNGSSLTLNQVIVLNNAAQASGGGLSALNSNVTLIGTTVRKNIGVVGGGGLVTAGGGSLTITNSLVADNSTSSSVPGDGGGGFLLAGTGDVNITDTEVAGNTTPGDGGGLLNTGAAKLTISSCTFNDNHALGQGGGLNLQTTLPCRLTNVTISGNSAGLSGGGLFNVGSGDKRLQNATIAFNTAVTGGGLFSAASTLALSNTIVARNTATGSFPDVHNNGIPTALADIEGNFIGDNAGAADSFAAGTPNNHGSFVGRFFFNAGTGGGILLPLDPLLEPLADNGGTTVLPDGHHLLTHQNQANSGVNGVRDRATGQTQTFDARGFPQPAGPKTDIGAFEFQDADMTVRTDAPAGTVHAGLPVSLSLAVTNNGPNASRGVTLTDTLPPGTTVVTAPGNFTLSGNVVTLAVPDLAAGASTVLTVTVIPAAAGPFSATAALSSHDDPNLTNNTASVNFTLLPRPSPAPGSADVTALVKIALQGRRRPRKQLLFRLTNISSTPIQGPVGVVVAGLPRRVKLRNSSGLTADRQKFVRLDVGSDNILDPGESTTFQLVFSRPMNPRALRVLAGTFA
jgi:uncharacterized repeat protein (TIGR01451 family)